MNEKITIKPLYMFKSVPDLTYFLQSQPEYIDMPILCYSRSAS